jgi:hypothetical protein
MNFRDLGEAKNSFGRHIDLTAQRQLDMAAQRENSQAEPGTVVEALADPSYRLAVPGLGAIRALAFEIERSIQQGDAVGARAQIALMERALKSVPEAYSSFRYHFTRALADLSRRMESPGFRGFRHATAAPIAAIIALLGPRFVGRKIEAQFGGACTVCGDPCVKGETILYDDATKRGAHEACGERAR